MAKYYLLDKKNPHGPHFHTSRKHKPRVIVIHITAGLEEFKPPDHAAEQTAKYAATTNRKVSWHSGSDSDTFLRLLPASYTAFHVQGYNSIAIGLEISKRHTTWKGMPDSWVESTLRNAAQAVSEWVKEYDIPLRRISRDDVDRGKKGFASHHSLDPSRRSDPGADFPWDRFLRYVKEAVEGKQEDDVITEEDVQRIAQKTVELMKNSTTHFAPPGDHFVVDDESAPEMHGQQFLRSLGQWWHASGEGQRAQLDRLYGAPRFKVPAPHIGPLSGAVIDLFLRLANGQKMEFFQPTFDVERLSETVATKVESVGVPQGTKENEVK